ncbi:DNA-binding transcription factor [Aureococcus anophagefferens]|uniref:DNA-binding transcription factor n=1 Tax=Aureococcus anophagefferens TaxID=44056 RepID=A0ABR1FLD9_AURAN
MPVAVRKKPKAPAAEEASEPPAETHTPAEEAEKLPVVEHDMDESSGSEDGGEGQDTFAAPPTYEGPARQRQKSWAKIRAGGELHGRLRVDRSERFLATYSSPQHSSSRLHDYEAPGGARRRRRAGTYARSPRPVPEARVPEALVPGALFARPPAPAPDASERLLSAAFDDLAAQGRGARASGGAGARRGGRGGLAVAHAPDDLLDGLDVPGLGDPVDLSRIVLDLRDRVEKDEIGAPLDLARGASRTRARASRRSAARRWAPRRASARPRRPRASREKELQRSFSRAGEALNAVVEKQRGTIRERYGYVEPGGKVGGRRYAVNWDLIPRPIEIRVHGLRAVKDKLPKGTYVIMVSMQDRLAGRPLRWTKTHSYGGGGFGPKPAATRPFRHKGRYHDVDLKVNQSIFALCPSMGELRPANCLVFELFRLADKRNPRDAVVGWSALPLCDPHFAVIKGKFKVPVLRGEVKPHFDRFSMIQDAYVNDLSAWLGNMYVEIRYLPRETIDPEGNLKDEYHVEYDFINKLLQLGDTARGARGGLRKGHGSTSESAREGKDGDTRWPWQKKRDAAKVAPGDDEPAAARRPKRRAKPWWARRQTIFDRRGSTQRKRSVDKGDAKAPLLAPGQLTLPESRKDLELEDMHTGQQSESSGDELFFEDRDRSKVTGTEAVQALSSEEDEPHFRGKFGDGARYDPAGLGLHGTDRAAQDVDDDDEAWWTDLRVAGARDHFYFSVAEEPGRRRPPTATAIVITKFKFVWQELFMDLSSDVRAADYAATHNLRWQWARCSRIFLTGNADSWLVMVLCAMALWMRVYVHYTGQWLLLSAQKVAIYGFRAQLWGFEFKYMPDGLKTMEEVGVVGMGGISVLLAFLGLVGVCRLYQSTGSALPDPVSQYVAAFGLGTLLDPLLVLAVDILASNYACDTRPGCRKDYTKNSCDCFEGDAFKLWRRMVDEENGGIIGIFYVVIIYAIHVSLSLAVCYYYLVFVHMNGRVIDTYSRINGDSETFFVPHDFELSVEELNHVIAKAKKWIGPADQRRHVAIATYDLKDPLLPHFKDTSTHVTIYEHALDGAQKVYRHFLRSPDGCITEIFGSNDATQIFGTARPVDHGDGDDDAGGKGKGGAATDDPAALPQLNGYFAGVRPI